MISSGIASFLSACLVSSLVISAGIAAQPGAIVNNPQASSSSLPPIRDMKLLTSTSGWILAGQKILWTETAGQNWTDITPPLASTQALDTTYFFDIDHCWAVLHSPATESTLPGLSVAITADRGKSWSAADLPSDQYFREGAADKSHFSFSDPARGWLIVQKMTSSARSWGDLFTTRDGGNTWSALPRPPIFGEIKFFPDFTGWLVGGVNDDELYKTPDGGQTWVRKVIELPHGVQPYSMPEGMGFTYVGHPQYIGPHFSDEADGIIEVLVPVKQIGDSRQLIYTTDNGGETWTLQTKPTAQYDGSTPAFFGSTWVRVTHSDAKVVIEGPSHNATFALPKDVPQDLAIVKVDFIDAEHGWLLTKRGALLAVTGGASLNVLTRTAAPNTPDLSIKPHAELSPATPQPLIGGTTSTSTVAGIDSCQAVPPQYVNSLYGPYGQEISNGTYNLIYGFYVGGLEAVHTPNPNCYIANAAYINQTACQGWKYLPIWNGYQAPCGPDAVTISPVLSTAAAQGSGDADSVAAQLINIGLSGSVAYLDIEQYPTGNSSCSQIVRTYVNAWVGEMHNKHVFAGVYGSASNISADMQPGDVANVPNDVWVANYSTGAQTTNLSPIPSGYWTVNQRAHQYQGTTALIPATTNSPLPHSLPYSFDLDIVNSAVSVLLNPPASCDEGCSAACYNTTSQWCGSTCMNCVTCNANYQASCVNGTAECTETQSYCNNEICAGGVAENFAEYPNGCSSSYFPDDGCCCYASPIVIDAFGEGFHLTNAAGGVKFTTLPAAGLEQLSWTDAQWHNGWLALDRNGNGRIDNFTELFGNLTAQPTSDDENGYLALAVFDDPANGGNGNGFIDPGDSVYDHLLLWIDANHNGISEPEELHSLRDVGVFKIDLKFHDSSYTDVNGNRFRYESKIWDKAFALPRKSYDVFLTIDTQQ